MTVWMILVASLAAVQPAGTFNLVIQGQSSVVVPYPNKVRCLAALEAIQNENLLRQQRAESNNQRMAEEASRAGTQPGYIIASSVTAYCIPG